MGPSLTGAPSQSGCDPEEQNDELNSYPATLISRASGLVRWPKSATQSARAVAL